MEKLVYVIWDRPSLEGGELRVRYSGTVVPELLGAGARNVSLHLDDDLAPIAGPAPCPGGELPYRAVVSLWLDAHDDRAAVESVLDGLGVRRAGYLVSEAEFGSGDQQGDHHGDPVPGKRSPGISTVALVHRNPRFDPRTFREFWYDHQSPMSGEVQPRVHYVRNSVVHPVTRGAPPIDGIVMECWPDIEVVSDPIEFHGGAEVGEENLTVMLDSVTQLFDLSSLRSLAMSEYLFEPL
ncbi:MAG: hypothetical protein R2714_06840 [Microthrixaceae bacterium]